jgi:hypothetical protein
MMPMKQVLLLIFVLSFSVELFSQSGNQIRLVSKETTEQPQDIVTIYPVPVKENNFTIESKKEISFIKVTNIIGQDIYRVKYTTPQLFVKISLDNPRRGMYLVVILFNDNTRIVKKIMIESNS